MPDAPPRTTTATVLVVDDHAEARDSVARSLRAAGFPVVEAGSGAEAIELARDGVHLVVLDVHRPDVHGVEIARRLGDDPRTAHLPVIHLSAAGRDVADRVRGLDSGAEAYLAQPVDPTELVATARALLRVQDMRDELRRLLAAERDASARLALLNEISIALSVATSRDAVGQAMLVPTVAALGAEIGDLSLLTPAGDEFEVMGIANGREPVVEAWRRFPRALATPVAAALDAGDDVVAWDAETIRARFPAIAPTLDLLEIASVWCVRLARAERVLGTMDLCFRTPRRPSASETALLAALGAQCVVALERVEFAAAERAAAVRAARLQELTGALSLAHTATQVVDAVVDHAADAFGAVGTVVAALLPDGATLELVRASGMPAESLAGWRRFPLAADVPLAEVTRTARPLLLSSPEEWVARYPHVADDAAAAGHRANAVLPLVVNGRAIGALGLAFADARTFAAADVALMATAANQVAQAIERARLYDAERAARTEAEQANRAKGEFLATMSHELRTPLNAIAGHAQLIEMGIHGPVSDAQRDALARVQRAQRHLLGLVNDVLDYARLERGHVVYEVTAVELAPVVAELEPMIGPQLAAKSLRYTTDVPDDCVVRADREKLVQVLLNLVSNAIKFTGPGGLVAVECAERSAHDGPPGLVFVRVVDSGIGIPVDKLDAVFDPFVQVDVSHAGRTAGTGLGLAISRDLARGMGGDLRVRSTTGVGTSFTVSLPGA